MKKYLGWIVVLIFLLVPLFSSSQAMGMGGKPPPEEKQGGSFLDLIFGGTDAADDPDAAPEGGAAAADAPSVGAAAADAPAAGAPAIPVGAAVGEGAAATEGMITTTGVGPVGASVGFTINPDLLVDYKLIPQVMFHSFSILWPDDNYVRHRFAIFGKLPPSHLGIPDENIQVMFQQNLCGTWMMFTPELMKLPRRYREPLQNCCAPEQSLHSPQCHMIDSAGNYECDVWGWDSYFVHFKEMDSFAKTRFKVQATNQYDETWVSVMKTFNACEALPQSWADALLAVEGQTNAKWVNLRVLGQQCIDAPYEPWDVPCM